MQSPLIRKKTLFLLLVFVVLFSTVFAGGNKHKESALDKKINALISQMTLQEKVNLLHGNTMFTNGGCERLGIPQLKLSDGPHGVREEISLTSFRSAGWTTDSASYFPTETAVAATWNRTLAYKQGEALGAEFRARKKDIMLGPGVNIIRTPLGGRNFEYLSEDPLLVSEMVVPYIQGAQTNDVAACVKHFALNNQELDRGIVDVYLSERALREIYLPGFKAAVQQGKVLTVMSSYNKLRGDWCGENRHLLTNILRNEWGFKGLVMSDWGGTHSTVKAANAGLDLEMGTRGPFSEFYFANPLIKAVETGEVSENVVDDKVRNILRVLYGTKLMGDTLNRTPGEFVTPAHSKVAYDVAKESIVLLKNEKNTLPLKRDSIKTIAVFGDNATRKHSEGGFSSGVKSKYEITPLEGIKSRAGDDIKINYSLGYEKVTSHTNDDGTRVLVPKYDADSLLRAAVKIALQSDVAIIFAGLNHDFDTESYDKKDMNLPYTQEDLINVVAKVNPNTIVVITAGSPIDFRKIEKTTPVIVWSWFNGMEGGNAIADVIFGNVNPSGKMPFTLPESLEQSPAHALGNYHGKEKPLLYEEDILVGYRWFDAKGLKPAFPFGHGLSYTTFTYSDVKVRQNKKEVKVTFTIQNTGNKAGAEVAQVYISAPGKEALRPPLELKGFEKINLEPGKEAKVEIKINKDDMKWYNEAIKDWQLEKGKYRIEIGASSRDIRLKKEIEIK